MADFSRLKSIPKVELHAHLFGCIPISTLEEISASKGNKQGAHSAEAIPNTLCTINAVCSEKVKRKRPDLGDAFEYFGWVYSVVRTRRDIERIIDDVLRSFYEENVVYLELRTVRVIISLDRRHMDSEKSSSKQIEDAYSVAEAFPEWIVGFDIAGRPGVGNLSYTLDRLKKDVISQGGRFYGSKKVTVHTAEIDGDHDEIQAILSIRPHRIGHGCFLSEDERRQFSAIGTFVEVCPTSNMCTMQLRDIGEHPFGFYHSTKTHLDHLCICTDDTGLFQTSLSRELHLLSSRFALSANDINALQRNALEAAFCSKDLKQLIYSRHFKN